MNEQRKNKGWVAGGVLVALVAAGSLLARRGGPEQAREEGDERPPPEAPEALEAPGPERSPSPSRVLASAPPGEERWDAADLPGLEAREAEAETPEQRARRVVLPVLQAIRNPELEPEERRLCMLAALEDSGPSDEPWTTESRSIFSGWSGAFPSELELNVDVDGARCYRAGCVVPVTFADRETYERAAREFRKIPEEGATHGGRVQTPADFGADGKLEASWIFLRPPR